MSEDRERPLVAVDGADAGSARATLHLASQSPRRRRLLTLAGIPHDAESPGVDDAELYPGRRCSPRAWTVALAHLKARAALERLRGEGRAPTLILAADTMVVKDGALIGKPRDREHARRILLRLDRGTHEVVSGAALIERETRRRLLIVDVARVRVGEIGQDRIETYLASGDWSGKAGAYNLDERVADGWPIEHQGDASTVMGLPMRRLLPVLAEFGVIPAGTAPC